MGLNPSKVKDSLSLVVTVSFSGLVDQGNFKGITDQFDTKNN